MRGTLSSVDDGLAPLRRGLSRGWWDYLMTEPTRSALIFGARNLGRAIIETLVAQGWNVAGAARSVG
jgi:hypothetical protein